MPEIVGEAGAAQRRGTIGQAVDFLCRRIEGVKRIEAAFLGQHELQKIEHVARIQRARVGRDERRQIRLSDQRNAVLLHRAAGFGQRAVAAVRRSQVDDHRARLHRLDHLFGDEHRRRAARDQRGGDDDVGGGDALGDLDLLPVEPALRHRSRVAADAFGSLLLFGGLVGHVDELRAQRFDLLLHTRPHVARFDDRAEPLRGRDRLQAGNADAEDHDARGFHGAGRGHQHRQETLVLVSGHEHCLVAGDVRLRREHVHTLRTRRSRRGFEREAREARAGEAVQPVAIERVEHADEVGARLHQLQLAVQR